MDRKRATITIPIISVAVLQTEIGPKCLELLHSAVPVATRIAVLWHSGSPSTIPGLKALEGPARLLRLELQPVGAQTAADLEGAFSTMARRGAQALLVFNTVPFITARQRIAELAVAHRLPAARPDPRDPAASRSDSGPGESSQSGGCSHSRRD